MTNFGCIDGGYALNLLDHQSSFIWAAASLTSIVGSSNSIGFGDPKRSLPVGCRTRNIHPFQSRSNAILKANSSRSATEPELSVLPSLSLLLRREQSVGGEIAAHVTIFGESRGCYIAV
jgi:hypothetical protein